MNFTGVFIRRPVMTTLLMAAILVFGIASYRKLTVSDLPAVDYPTINVSANLPGASPETMAATVATPLEKAFSAIAGIDNITSSSGIGNTNVTLQFSPDRDIDAAAQDVNAAISGALAFLPSTIIPPSYRKQNPAASPILFFALTSSDLSLTALDEVAETTIAQRLSQVEGVSQVSVFGSAKYAVRVELDPSQLTTRGLSVSDIATAVRNNNVILPTGVLYGKDRTLTIQATGQLSNADQFRSMVVANRNGAPVHLSDLGNVKDDVQNNKNASWYNGDRAIVLAVMRQPGTITVAVADRVKAALEEIKPTLPPSVNIITRYDRSIGIRSSVDDVKHSLIIALVLVVLVIFVFLRNFTATAIPSLTLPMAIVGTFSVMYALDFSIDNLSLMALTLAVGFVVDDAIVMLENIVRHIGSGPDARTGRARRRRGGRVHDPLDDAVARRGVHPARLHGRHHRPAVPRIRHHHRCGDSRVGFRVADADAHALRALSQVAHRRDARPAVQLLRERVRQDSPRILNARSAGACAFVLLTLVFSAVILFLTGLLFTVVPKGLFPSDDTGLLNGTTEAAQGTSFPRWCDSQLLVNAALVKDTQRRRRRYMSSVMGGNRGDLNIILKPAGTRPSADVMVQQLTRKLNSIPGVQVFIQNPPSIRIGGRGSKTL